jgi:hypothetical protein
MFPFLDVYEEACNFLKFETIFDLSIVKLKVHFQFNS